MDNLSHDYDHMEYFGRDDLNKIGITKRNNLQIKRSAVDLDLDPNSQAKETIWLGMLI